MFCPNSLICCCFCMCFMFFRSHVYLPGPTPIWDMLVVRKKFGFIPQMPPILRPESIRVHLCRDIHTPNLSDESTTRERTHTLRAQQQNMCSHPQETWKRQNELIINYARAHMPVKRAAPRHHKRARREADVHEHMKRKGETKTQRTLRSPNHVRGPGSAQKANMLLAID